MTYKHSFLYFISLKSIFAKKKQNTSNWSCFPNFVSLEILNLENENVN